MSPSRPRPSLRGRISFWLYLQRGRLSDRCWAAAMRLAERLSALANHLMPPVQGALSWAFARLRIQGPAEAWLGRRFARRAEALQAAHARIAAALESAMLKATFAEADPRARREAWFQAACVRYDLERTFDRAWTSLVLLHAWANLVFAARPDEEGDDEAASAESEAVWPEDLVLSRASAEREALWARHHALSELTHRVFHEATGTTCD